MVVPLRGIVAAVLASALLAAPRPTPMRVDAAPATAFATLIYHHVKPLRRTDNAIERGLTVLPGQFRAQLQWLAGRRYRLLSAAQAVAILSTRRPLPSPGVCLTFDDGYADMYTEVYPLLRARHWTATFFIVPGFLGQPRYLTWGEVEEMARHGMDIEAHTMTHPDLRLIPSAAVPGELRRSRAELQSRLHHAVRVMAYPYGGFNPTIVAEVKAAGYTGAFTTEQGYLRGGEGLLTLPRVYIDGDDSPQIFAGRVMGDPRILAEDPT